MNPEIRFNPPPRPSEGSRESLLVAGGISQPSRSGSVFKKVLKILALVVILMVLTALGLWGKRMFLKTALTEGVFSAVFLTNGQVYFGEMVRNDDKEIVLNNVFYLQVGESGEGVAVEALNQTRFNLVKLGKELHGPTDELFINKSQVTFYEKLRADSKVVESIKNYK